MRHFILKPSDLTTNPNPTLHALLLHNRSRPHPVAGYGSNCDGPTMTKLHIFHAHLVHDDDIVHGQEGVARHLSQQKTLGEEERSRVLCLGPFIADLIRNGRPVRVERLCKDTIRP